MSNEYFLIPKLKVLFLKKESESETLRCVHADNIVELETGNIKMVE